MITTSEKQKNLSSRHSTIMTSLCKFTYDKEFGCLVKSIGDREDTRISLDKEDLDMLYFDLWVILNELEFSPVGEQDNQNHQISTL